MSYAGAVKNDPMAVVLGVVPSLPVKKLKVEVTGKTESLDESLD